MGSKSITVAALSERRYATVRHRRYRSQLTFFGRARSLGAAVALGEFFDATGGVDEFLFAGEKRMTSGTDTDSNVFARRAGMINRATRTHDIGLVIFWMNVCFHLQKGARNLAALVVLRKG